jgi:WD40 repeat protein
VARYRAGDVSGAAELLEQAAPAADDGSRLFFLAMARWQSSDREEARKCYGRAVEWMAKYRPEAEELRRFRAEASALLGMGGSAPWVSSGAWSPDGKHFATVASRKEPADTNGKPDADPALITVWEASTKQQILHFSERITSSLSWSPDGQRLAAGGCGFVKVWQASTGHEVLALRTPHQDDWAQGQLWWSPDGQRLVATSSAGDGRDAEVTVWDLNTRAILFSTPGGLGTTWSETPFSPDGKWLLLAKKGEKGEDSQRVVDARTGEEVASLLPGITGEAWSPDGKRLLTVTGETVTILGVPTFREEAAFRLRRAPHGPMRWSTDGKRLVCFEQRVSPGVPWRCSVRNATTGQELSFFEVPSSTVLGWFSPDGQRVATLTADRRPTVWDVVTGQQVFASSIPSEALSTVYGRDSLNWSPDGRRLLIVSEGKVEIWDATAERDFLLLHATDDFLSNKRLAWSPDGRRVAARGWMRSSQPSWKKRHSVVERLNVEPGQGVVAVWDSDTGEQVLALPAHAGDVPGVAWSPDGKSLATMGEDEPAPDDPAPVPGTVETWDRIKVWDARTGRKIAEWRAHSSWGQDVTWSPDGKLLASTGWDETFDGRWIGRQHSADPKSGLWPAGKRERFLTIRVWDAATGQEVFHISHPAGLMIAWSPDGARLAAYGSSSVRVWDTHTWQELVPPQEAPIPRGGAPSPDRKRIAVAGNDIKVWDVTRGQVVLHLIGNSRGIGEIAWSADGQRLVSAGRDGLLRFWDTTTGQVLSIPRESAGDAALAWSPDGRRLAVSDGWAQLYDTGKHDSWLPSVAHTQNQLALAWATHQDPKLRDPIRAVTSAKKAVELAPRIGVYWATLGLAHYRAGNWKDAVQALERSMELRWGGDGTVWFYLAMAHWQLGEKEQARKWYDEAVRWMEQPDLRRQADDIPRLRAEAAELLLIKEPPPKGTDKG